MNLKLDMHLVFDGECRAAIEYYADVLGRPPEIVMTFGQMAMTPERPVLPGVEHRILYSTILLDNGSKLMMSDVMPGMGRGTGGNTSLTITSRSEEEIRFLFYKLKPESRIIMPLQETFWSPCAAMLTDRFSTNWIVSCDGYL